MNKYKIKMTNLLGSKPRGLLGTLPFFLFIYLFLFILLFIYSFFNRMQWLTEEGIKMDDFSFNLLSPKSDQHQFSLWKVRTQESFHK